MLALVLSARLSWHYLEGGFMIGSDHDIPSLVSCSQWVITKSQNADDLVMILPNSIAVPRP